MTETRNNGKEKTKNEKERVDKNLHYAFIGRGKPNGNKYILLSQNKYR
jgi:hypothetical protein